MSHFLSRSGAYVPLSCAIIEDLLFRGYDACKEYLGSLTSHLSTRRGGVSARPSVTTYSTTPSSFPSGASVLVFFLGGVTFAEIAALRFLGKVKGVKFIIATTAVINGDSLIESIADAL